MKSSKSNTLRNILNVRVPADYPWKVLDTLVQDLSQSLNSDDLQYASSVTRTRDFAQYLELSDRWSPQSMGPTDISKMEFIAKYQIASLMRKFQFPTDAKLRRETASQKFLEAEEVCKEYNRSGWKTLACLEDETELEALTYAQRFIQHLLGPVLPEHSRLTLWSRHGPGANLDTRKGQTSLYDKYRNWPYSCTSGAVGHARKLILSDERWHDALVRSYKARYKLPSDVSVTPSMFWPEVLKIVPGNRITFVPKNSQTDRSIAIEPCMNLCLQLGVDGYIRRRLKRWGVDLDDQLKNQALAGDGSRNWDSPESKVTLDLAAASDSVSTELCRLLLPPQWYTYLMAIRSPSGELGQDTILYEKISSMGNGYTFALESAIFTAVIYGCTKALTGKYDRNSCAVFGDDLIVPRTQAQLVVRMLNLCGFGINDSKSFQHGYFRESCGADWFKGTLVRPVFLTSQPTTVMEIWCDVNRIRRFLSLRVGIGESLTEKLIDKWIPEQFRDFIGPFSSEDFDSYKHSMRPRLRYNEYMWETRRLVITHKRLRGDEFDFRKLMAPLRSAMTPSSKFQVKTWRGGKIVTGGNVFDITNNKSVIPCVTPLRTSVWSEEYTEDFTYPRPRKRTYWT